MMLGLFFLLCWVEVIGLLFFIIGIVAVVRGKIALHREFAAEDMPARVVGIIFALITPLTMLARYVIVMAFRPAPGQFVFDPAARRLAAKLDFSAVMGLFTVAVVAAIAVVAAYRKRLPNEADGAGPRNPFAEPPAAEPGQLAEVVQVAAADITTQPRPKVSEPWQAAAHTAAPPRRDFTLPKLDGASVPLTPATKLAIVGAGVALLFGMLTVVAFFVIRQPGSPGHAITSFDSSAPGVLFADSFNRPTLGPSWKCNAGAWSLTGGILSQTDAGFGDPRKAMVVSRAFPANLEVKARLRVDSWDDGEYARAGIGLATDPASGAGYNLAFHWHERTRHKVQFLDDGNTWANAYPFEWKLDTWYWFKLKRENGVLYGKVWADGNPEPAGWPYVQDGWFDRRNGVPALNGGSGHPGLGNSRVSFTDVEVAELPR
jgi:hypothetical protein